MEIASRTNTENGSDQQRRGFHTFVMTGDAIIRTNFNPFKPTRQLSLDSNVETLNTKSEAPKTDRSISHEDKTCESTTPTDNNNSENQPPATPITPSQKQDKEFIPGFIRVDGPRSPSRHKAKERRIGLSVNQCLNQTEDSGIDVQLSDEDSPRQPSDTQDTDSAQHRTDSQVFTTVTHVPEGAETQADIDPQSVADVLDEMSNQDSSDIDEASVKRLATRLYQLDGFKLSDVCHYLSKSNEFSQRVAEEFLKFFDFTDHSLVDSLRAFLSQISLEGGLEDKEKVLLFFTKRYLECNKDLEQAKTFHSEDSCHTLVCALMLLNNDLHTSNLMTDERITQRIFIENLSQLNGGRDYDKDMLTSYYNDICQQPLAASNREEDLKRRLSDAFNYGVEPIPYEPPSAEGSGKRRCYSGQTAEGALSSHLNQSSLVRDLEHVQGYMLKKHCKGPNGIKTPSGRRGWKRHFVMVQNLHLMMFKSDKHSHISKTAKLISLDNAYAAIATHYTKRKNGFTIVTSDGSEYLFIAGDKSNMENWISYINLLAAAGSKEQQANIDFNELQRRSSATAPLGSRRRMRDQLHSYEVTVKDAGNELLVFQNNLPSKGATKQSVKEFTEKQMKCQHQIQKCTAYVAALRYHLDKFKPRSDSVTVSIAEEPDIVKLNNDQFDGLNKPGTRTSYQIAVYGKKCKETHL